MSTEAATGLTASQATLKGSVNPNGAATTYQFEYGTTTSYGTKAPASLESAGSGTKAVALSKAISGLKEGTTYHFRVVATNEGGTSYGEDKTFTSLKLPSVTTGTASPSETYALLSGSVTPNGQSTSYQFEYGLTTSYGSKAPAKAEGAGSGTTPVGAATLIEDLSPATTYHFRLTATSTAGTAYGEDKALTTRSFPQTTITSQMPTYTSNETPPPVEFTSSHSGSTFKCGFDEGEEPKKSCTSPYVLPEHLSAGWHTFVVAATDSKGETDPTPAKYTFNPDIYPPASATSKLISPGEGEKTASYYTLQAQWGEAPPGGGVSGISFQVKMSWESSFHTIPAECVIDQHGQPISWPIAATENPGHSAPVFFGIEQCPLFAEQLLDEGIKFRAIFDGGPNAAGASKPVATEFVTPLEGIGAPTDATEQVGPAALDLLTGRYTVSRTDVSIPVPGSEANLEFTRTYESDYVGQAIPTYVLGGNWQPSGPVERQFEGEAWTELRERHVDAVKPVYDEECREEGYSDEECMIEEEIPAADWIELLDNEGGAAAFEIGQAGYIAPEYMKEYVLTKQGTGESTTYELASPVGTHTLFVKNSAGIVGSYRPKSVSWQATSKSARLVYEPGFNGYQLSEMIAPAAVSCTDAEATHTAGCRALTFQYQKCESFCKGGGIARLSSIKYFNASGNEALAEVVAKYEYDSNGLLSAEWDPRVSPCTEGTPCMKETYAYSETKLLALTPPGEEPWEFAYENHGYGNGRLKSVSRASLLKSPTKAQTTIVYEVPISGSGAPYDMSPESVAEWGQTDYPVNATAIFPPTEIPGKVPSDYDQATVHYMDPDGYEVNAASPSPPGVEGATIATSETDRHGNVVRELNAQNRLAALEAEAPVARSHELDSHSEYTEDGTEMLQSWGPLHTIRLKTGEAAEARSHAKVEYDKDFKLKAGEVAPHLPTKETVTAFLPSKEEELEPQVTETRYEWTLRKPIESIVDPDRTENGVEVKGLNLRTRIAYDPKTGLPTERSLPAKYEGGDAHTTKTRYYGPETITHEGCESNAWAGLPCEVKPAAQPGTVGQPELLVTKYTSYNSLDEPTAIIESPGGGGSNQRKSFTAYDSAGRVLTTRQEGGGKALPKSETVYSGVTGRPIEQRFVCESQCNAPRFLGSFGSLGSGSGQLNGPRGVAADKKGHVWVVDRVNNRVEEFTEHGEYLRQFGSSGSGNGQFNNPGGIVVTSSGNLWVADTGNFRVEEFNEKGGFIQKFGTKASSGSNGTEFKEPEGIAVAPSGMLWISDGTGARVGEFRESVASESERFVRNVSTTGTGNPGLLKPLGVAIDSSGNLWVADEEGNHLLKYNSTGSFLQTAGSSGSGNGQLNGPTGVSISPSGNIIVADRGNNRVEEFHSDGTFFYALGTAGSGSENLSEPRGLALGAGNEVFIADKGNNRVRRAGFDEAFNRRATKATYDAVGRPIEYADADGNVSTIEYDLLGRPILTKDVKGAQAMRYDEASGVLVELEDSSAGIFSANYNADGAMTEELLPNGLAARMTYDPAGEAIGLSYQKITNCSMKCTWLEFDAERSATGQILHQSSTLSSETYQYDKAGRLTLAEESPAGGSCTTRSYSFDADSNRTARTTREPGLGGACDTESSGSTQKYSYDAADRLLGEGIEYDSWGRITKLPGVYAGGKTLETSFYSNEMSATQSQGEITNNYQLDATGRVREATQSKEGKETSEIFHYDGPSDSPAWTEDNESHWTRNIAAMGGLGAIENSATKTTTLQLSDLHGDVVATASLSPTATEPTATFQFDEFGNPVKGSAGRFGWLGSKQRRTELPSGVIQMGVRSYVPAIGRFISTDPVLGGSANAYDYANADPLNALDLTGTAADAVVGCFPHTTIHHPHHSKHNRGHVNAVVSGRCVGNVPGRVKLRVTTSLYRNNHFVTRQTRTVYAEISQAPSGKPTFSVPLDPGPVCKAGNYQAFATVTAFFPPGLEPPVATGIFKSAKTKVEC